MNSCAVHFSAASEARNSAMFATSSGSTRAFKHCPAITSFSTSGVYHNLICRSVHTAPGEIVFTRIPKGPNSRARTRVNPVTDAFVTLYIGRPVSLSLQIIDPRLIMPAPPTRADNPRPNPPPPAGDKHRLASQPRVPCSFARIHTSQPPRPRRDATLLIFHFKGNLCAEAQRRRAEDARRTQRATRAQSERSGSSRGAGPCLVLLQYWSEYVVPNLGSTLLRYLPD